MEYKIYCKNAKSLISTIFGCFKKKDKDGTYTYYWLSIYDDHSHAYMSHSKDKDKLYEAGNGIGGKRG